MGKGSRNVFTNLRAGRYFGRLHMAWPEPPRTEKMAMNLARDPKDKHRLKVRGKLANLNRNYLNTLIRQTSSLT